MAKVVFKSYNPNDSLLLPPCLGDYLPQNHPARVVSAIIDRLDKIGYLDISGDDCRRPLRPFLTTIEDPQKKHLFQWEVTAVFLLCRGNAHPSQTVLQGIVPLLR